MLRRSTRASAIALGVSAWIGTAYAQEEPGVEVPAEVPPAAEIPASESPEEPKLPEDTDADRPHVEPAQKQAAAASQGAPSEPAATDEGLAGYTPSEGFRIKSSDGNYMMRFALTAGFKFEPAWNDGERTLQGALAFVRPAIRGNFYQPWLRYALSLELAQDDAYLLGATVEAQPWDEFGAHFGQQRRRRRAHASPMTLLTDGASNP